MGSINQRVWEYDETDAGATASDLFNLGMDTVRDALVEDAADIANLQTDLTAFHALETTQPSITRDTTNVSSISPSIARKNGVLTGQVGFTMAAARAAGTTTALTLGTMPAGFRPVGYAPMVTENGVFGWVHTDGTLRIGYNATAIAAASTVYFKFSYGLA